MSSGVELARASVMVDIGRYDDAAALLASVLAADPENSRAWCLLARAQLGSGDHARAVASARRAGALNPADEWPHRLASAALIQEGQHAEALTAALEARRLAPQLWRSHVCVAQAAIAVKNLGLAGEAAAAALAIGPDETDVQFCAGRVALAQGDAAAARSHLASALAINPGHAAAMNELGRIRLKEKDAAGAAGHFIRAARSAPSVNIFGRNTEIALTRVIIKIIYIWSLAVTAVLYLVMVANADRVLLTVVLAAAGVLAAAYSVALVRRLPAQARKHLGRMIRRRRVALPIAIVVTASLAAVALLLLGAGRRTGGLLPFTPDIPFVAVILVAGSSVLSFHLLRRAARRDPRRAR